MRSGATWNLLAGFASVGGMIASLVLIGAAIYANLDANVLAAILALAGLALCSTISAMYLFREFQLLVGSFREKETEIRNLKKTIRKWQNEQREAQETIDSICHGTANICNDVGSLATSMLECISDVTIDGTCNDEEKGRLRTRFLKSTQAFLTNVSNLMSKMTGCDCASCIKIISAEDSKPMIRTYYRDPISFRSRGNSDNFLNEYRAHENTAFKNIIDRSSSDVFYISNNLKKEDNYRNANENWVKHYNACIVAPIKTKIEETDYSCIGFLCTDNKKGGFRENSSLQLLIGFADLYYCLLQTYGVLLELIASIDDGESTGPDGATT